MNITRPTTTRRMPWPALAAGASLLLAGQAWAQAPWSALSLSFLQPSGSALATDTIEVWLRLSNHDATETFTVDDSLPNGGLNPADLPTATWVDDPVTGGQMVDFARYTGFSLGTGYGCSGSFSAACGDGPPYVFSWNGNPLAAPFSLGPGQQLDFLWGRFSPTGGAAPAGSYEFYRAVLWLDVMGEDADGKPLSAVAFPATTCRYDTAAECAGLLFTRDVSAVPEVQSYALMLGGLPLLAWLARRRRPR